ncbi:MAG: hypothetical protein ABIP61_08370 [Burkholderiaceae bacterium]
MSSLPPAVLRSLVRWIVPAACALGLQACAQTVATPASGTAAAPAHDAVPGLRVALRTVADPASPEALAQQLGRSAGVPVRHLTLLAPRRATLTLVCPDAAACEVALQRLEADRDLVADVQPDRRQRRPTDPSRSTSR